VHIRLAEIGLSKVLVIEMIRRAEIDLPLVRLIHTPPPTTGVTIILDMHPVIQMIVVVMTKHQCITTQTVSDKTLLIIQIISLRIIVVMIMTTVEVRILLQRRVTLEIYKANASYKTGESESPTPHDLH